MIADLAVSQKVETESHNIVDFDKIVAENEGKIFNTIYSLVGNYEDAMDLTQETFISAYRSIGKFRHEASISTWLYRIAINLCKKSRMKKYTQNLVFVSSLDDPEAGQQISNQASIDESAVSILEADEQKSMLQVQIYALPKKYRTVIILKYLQDLSYEEIADIVGCNIGTVKSRLARGKEKLRQRLEKLTEVDYGEL